MTSSVSASVLNRMTEQNLRVALHFGVHKGALTLLTKTLALEEMMNGITVNMVAPGSTRNAGSLPEDQRIPAPSSPLGRRVEMEEVVEAVMYFLFENAGSVTGHCIVVSGGLST